jgi:hypothetical protein
MLMLTVRLRMPELVGLGPACLQMLSPVRIFARVSGDVTID